MIVRSNHIDGTVMVIADVKMVYVPSFVDAVDEELQIDTDKTTHTIRFNIGDHLRVIEGETMILHLERGKDSFIRVVGEG